MRPFLHNSLRRLRGLFACAALGLICLLPQTSAADNTAGSPSWTDTPSRPHISSASDSNDRWSAKRIWGHLRTRSGVIQVCMGFMALGLFILMKKFADDRDRPTTAQRCSGENPTSDGGNAQIP
jgi:hypothetical protein